MYEFLVTLLQPFPILFVATALAVLVLWRRRRETRARLVRLSVAFAALALVCTPAVAHLALGSLEWHYPPRPRRPADVEGIVVLASGIRPPDEVFRPRAEADEDTFLRCRHAADLYAQGAPCP